MPPAFGLLAELVLPCLQSVIELSRTQDEEVGDGTTSVIVLGTPPQLTARRACVEAICTHATRAYRLILDPATHLLQGRQQPDVPKKPT